MSVTVVGISHRTAPLEVRERFVIGPEATSTLFARLTSAARTEAVLLSTCNRTELYLHADEPHASRLGTRLLTENSGMAEAEAGSYLYTMRERQAIEHLLRVVSSLDSMILGEAQIQGQVKSAYERAIAIGVGTYSAGPVLTRLFETALRVGGRVRTETRLGAGAASVPSAAVEMGRRTLGSLQGRGAVVIGAGPISVLLLRCLRSAGAAPLTMVSRSEARAREVAAQVGARTLPFDALPGLLRDADLLATATSAPHTVVSRTVVEDAMAGRDLPLVVLDVALPRDVESSVRQLPNVRLFDLDDLSGIVAGTLERRRSEVAVAEAIIDESVDEFTAWYRTRDVVPVIRGLRERAESLRIREIERARGALRDLSPAEREAVDHLTRQLLAKVLHAPTAKLREAAAAGGADVIETARYLFDLDQPPEETNR